MTRDDIICMAQEVSQNFAHRNYEDDLVEFFTMAYAAGAAAEREACAKVCADKVDAEYATGKVDHNEMAWTQACAIAIRARGTE